MRKDQQRERDVNKREKQREREGEEGRKTSRGMWRFFILSVCGPKYLNTQFEPSQQTLALSADNRLLDQLTSA